MDLPRFAEQDTPNRQLDRNLAAEHIGHVDRGGRGAASDRERQADPESSQHLAAGQAKRRRHHRSTDIDRR
jgi:hypothetical protein